jgi:hypothetical protein
MEGGFITKLIVGGVIMGLFVTMLVGLMAGMGQKYSVTLSATTTNQQAVFNANQLQLQSAFNNGTVTQLGSDIDSNAQDLAQYRGSIAGEQQKTTTGNIFASSITQLQEILPFDTAIANTLLFLVGVSLAVGIIYLIFRVLP